MSRPARSSIAPHPIPSNGTLAHIEHARPRVCRAPGRARTLSRMTLEIRPHRPDEAEAFNRVPQVVFGNYTVPVRVPEPGQEVIRPEWTLCAFEDGELATTYAAY